MENGKLWSSRQAYINKVLFCPTVSVNRLWRNINSVGHQSPFIYAFFYTSIIIHYPLSIINYQLNKYNYKKLTPNPEIRGVVRFYISVTMSFTVFPGGIIGSTFASGLILQSITTGAFSAIAFSITGLMSSVFSILIPATPKAWATFTKSVALWGSV